MNDVLIQNVKFSSKDLFALTKRFDIAGFIHSTVYSPQHISKKVIKKAHETLIDRQKKRNLVDSDGHPSIELEALIEPVRNPVLIIVDGLHPHFDEKGDDRRRHAFYFSRERITRVSRKLSLKKRFTLSSVLREDVEEVLLESGGCAMAYEVHGTWVPRDGFDVFEGHVDICLAELDVAQCQMRALSFKGLKSVESITPKDVSKASVVSVELEADESAVATLLACLKA